MNELSEYELRSSIAQSFHFSNVIFEFWLAVTFAVLFLLRDRIDKMMIYSFLGLLNEY